MRTVTFLLALLLAPSLVLAQITVDGDASEWTGTALDAENAYNYTLATAGLLNEFIWNDAAGDNRTDDFGGVVDGSKQDIEEIRLAGDATSLYFLLQLPSDVGTIAGNGAIQLQISLRRVGSTATTEYLGAFSDALVPTDTAPGNDIPEARWDYLIITRNGSQSGNNIVWTENFGVSTNEGALATNASNGVLEGSVPWSAIGGAPVDEDIVMTFSIMRADTNDEAFDTGGSGSKGDVLDYVTTTSGNTYGALIGVNNDEQGRLDYAVPVSFLAGSAIPVELSSFRAELDGAAARLSWTTASEDGNAGFHVEHAAPGAAFADLGFVSGAGTTTEAQRYAFTAEGLAPGTHRFRLRQVDHDGTEHLSPEVELVVGQAQALTLQAGPNPFAQRAEVRFSVADAQGVRAELFDALGRRVAVLHDGAASAGEVVRAEVDGAELPAGLYLVRLTTERGLSRTATLTLVR